MVKVSSALTVADGRVLGYGDFGDPTSDRVVMALHGTPTCSVGFNVLDEVATARGIRVLAPDRPGVCDSSPRPGGYELADVTSDIVTLADAFGVERFSLLGWSGGGPVALACAARHPDRVTAVATVGSMGPMRWPEATEGLTPDEHRLLDWSASHPGRAREYLRVLGALGRSAPKLARRILVQSLCESDRRVFTEGTPEERSMAFFTEVFRHGPTGAAHDYRAHVGDLGFAFDDVSVPVVLWHGDDDTIVPPPVSKRIATELRDATLVACPGEGHFLLGAHASELFDALT